MVQVLPAGPSFSSQIGQLLNNLGGEAAKAIKSRTAGKRFESLWQQIQNPQGQQPGTEIQDQNGQIQPPGQQNISPMQLVQLSDAATNYLGKDQSKVLTDELSAINQSNRKEQMQIRADERKEKKAAKEKKETTDELQKIFDKSVAYLDSGALGWSAGPFKSRENEQIRASFDAQNPKFINQVRRLENQGHITEAMFKEIEKSIPKASDSDRVIAGKLQGIADILGLNVDKLYEIPWMGKKVSDIAGKGTVKMISPNGVEVEVESDKVQQAINAGGKLK